MAQFLDKSTSIFLINLTIKVRNCFINTNQPKQVLPRQTWQFITFWMTELYCGLLALGRTMTWASAVLLAWYTRRGKLQVDYKLMAYKIKICFGCMLLCYLDRSGECSVLLSDQQQSGNSSIVKAEGCTCNCL